MVRPISYKTNIGPPVSWERLADEIGQGGLMVAGVGGEIAKNNAIKGKAETVVKADEKKGAAKPKNSVAIPDGNASERITPNEDPSLF
jgi:hypothetical protein